MKKPIFTWDLETGEALCVIKDKDKVYYGVAKCHPDTQCCGWYTYTWYWGTGDGTGTLNR